MKHSLILTLVFALTMLGVAMAHELEGNITVNTFGVPYNECVREASKQADRDLAVRWCSCVFEQMALHDREDRPDQKIFMPISKYYGHAVEVCKARLARGDL
jgi:hypothetical protein